jgi:hypothetical protein
MAQLREGLEAMVRTPVIVSKDGAVHYGVMIEDVDEPPVVVAAGRELYVHVWRARGWAVEPDEWRS